MVQSCEPTYTTVLGEDEKQKQAYFRCDQVVLVYAPEVAEAQESFDLHLD